jgi:hypothetical protein
MRYKRFSQASWALLLTVILVGMTVTPVSAANTMPRQPAHHQGTASLGATIYLSTSTLRSLFQSKLNQVAPSAVNSAISGMVSKLPRKDQGWAYAMATTLIQPSASLLSLAPQHAGLATTIRLSLYPGDPHPITSSMLVGFSVANASTVQVSAHSLNGSPALVNGPLTTFQIPVGQLNGINTTPRCGDSALAVNVHFPVTIGPLPTPPPPQGLNVPVQSHTSRVNYSALLKQFSPNGVATYVEIPSSSLAAIGPAIGSWQINDSLTAKNIRIGTQGSNLVIGADIFLGTSFRLATTLTTVAPSASGGNLVVHVLNTAVTIFDIFTFPYDIYNRQIEDILNSVLNGALGNKLYVTSARVGANGHVPCAAGDSLMLTGTASIG